MEAVNGNSLDATKARMLGADTTQDDRIFQSKRRLVGGVRWPHQQNADAVKPAGTVKNSPELCVARQRVSFVPPQSASRPNILKPSFSQKHLVKSLSTTSTTAPTMTPSSSEVELAFGSDDFSLSNPSYTPPPSTAGRDSTPLRAAVRPGAKPDRRVSRPRWR
jgi:hypothetical protein